MTQLFGIWFFLTAQFGKTWIQYNDFRVYNYIQRQRFSTVEENIFVFKTHLATRGANLFQRPVITK
jgi:hypothetical protein